VLIPGELFMIMDLHRQGLSVSAIARWLALDRKTFVSTSLGDWNLQRMSLARRGRKTLIRA
jgi:hypothetical protein